MKLITTTETLTELPEETLLSAEVEAVMMGSLPTKAFVLYNSESPSGNELTVADDNLNQPISADRTLLMVAFQFDQTPDVSKLKRYVDDRNPVLTRHGGRVVLSCVTPRHENWPFDGMEVIDFPEPGTIQALMQDTDYRSRTSESGSVFGSSFAVAKLAVS